VFFYNLAPRLFMDLYWIDPVVFLDKKDLKNKQTENVLQDTIGIRYNSDNHPQYLNSRRTIEREIDDRNIK